MIEQQGFLRLSRGSMGKTTFVKSRDGFRAQEKVIVSPGRFLNDPAFARTRENASEFGGAGTQAKVIRYSISGIIPSVSDKRLISRLLQRVSQVIKTDTTSPRGQGNIVDGNTALLKGFEFNSNGILPVVFKPDIATTMNRVTGQLTVDVPSFTPGMDLKAPNGSTHYQLVSAGLEIDFAAQTSKKDIKLAAFSPLDLTVVPAVSIAHTVTANSTLPLFLVFGVKFYKQDRGTMYPLVDASSNVLTIVDVSKV